MAKLVWTLPGRSPISQDLVIRLTCQHKTIKFFLTTRHYPYERLSQALACKEKFGQLVLLGFDVTAFTPAAYQRPSLERPSKEI